MKTEFMKKDIDMSTEVWRPYFINGTPSGYLVSNFGRVKSNIRKNHEYVKPQVGSGTHLIMSLVSTMEFSDVTDTIKRGKKKSVFVHRMVVDAFLDYFIIPEGYDSIDKLVIHHIDGIPFNNEITNLRIMTAHEHSKLHNREDDFAESRKCAPVLTDEQVHAVCKEIVKNRFTPLELSEKFNIGLDIIYAIITGRNYKDITKNYDFSHYKKMKKKCVGRVEINTFIQKVLMTGLGRKTCLKIISKEYNISKKESEKLYYRNKDIMEQHDYNYTFHDQKERYNDIHPFIERTLLYKVRTDEQWSKLIRVLIDEYGLNASDAQSLVKIRAAAIANRRPTVKIELPAEDDPVFLDFCKYRDSRKKENHVYMHADVEPIVEKALLERVPLADIKLSLMMEHGKTKNQASNILRNIMRRLKSEGKLKESDLVKSKGGRKKLNVTKKVLEHKNFKFVDLYSEIEEHLLTLESYQAIIDYANEIAKKYDIESRQAYHLVMNRLENLLSIKGSPNISLDGRGCEISRLRTIYRARKEMGGGKFAMYYSIVDSMLKKGMIYKEIAPILKQMNPDLNPWQMHGIVRNRKKALAREMEQDKE